MNFLKKMELTNKIIQELANCIVPSNWEKIIHYAEIFQDEDLGLRKTSTEECWIGPEMKLYRSSTTPPLDNTFTLTDLITELYELSENTNEQWCGLVIKLTRDGKYSTKFFYENTYLLDGNFSEVRKRILEMDI